MEKDDFEPGFQSWNPMLEDFNNTELNQYYSGPGVGLNDISQVDKQQQSSDKDQYSDLRGKLPYLLIRGTPPLFTKTTIYSILRYIPIHHIYYDAKSKTHFIYFNIIGDLEVAYRVLERIEYIPCVMVGHGQKKKCSNELNMDSKAGVTALPEPGNDINLEARTLKFSDKNPDHPNFGTKFILDPDIYNRKDSVLSTFDPFNRLKNVQDEFMLERYDIFKQLPCKIDETAHYVYSSGRLIKKFIGEKNFDGVPVLKKITFAGLTLKECYICGRLSSSYCGDCLTYYCRFGDCQSKLYDEHNLTCPKKITLVYKPQPIVVPKTIFQNKIPISGSLVELTAFQQSNVVYVRSLKSEENIGYLNVIKKVQQKGEAAEKYVELPKCGDLVIVSLDNDYLRALVLSVNGKDSIYVIYIDYGNVDLQPLDNFFVISDELAFLPCYVIAVQLKNVQHSFMSENYRGFLYHLLKNQALQIKYGNRAFDFCSGLHVVELFDIDLKTNINHNLNSLLTPRDLDDTNEIFYEKSLKRFSLPSDKMLELVITDNSLIKYGFISCTVKDLAYEIEKIQIDIQSYGESQKGSCYAPRVEELCIVKYEQNGKWYRGRCLELVGDGYPTIYFIDYGNISLVPVANIRKYPAMANYPILTGDVYLDGMKRDVRPDVIKRLQDAFPIGGTFKCELYKKKEGEDSAVYIKMPRNFEFGFN